MHKILQRSLAIFGAALFLTVAMPASATSAETQAKQSATPNAKQQQLAATFNALEKASWVAEGKGPRIVYIFFDPNCPYCHRLYEALRTRIGKNDLEFRWVPVGILMTTSFGKAAAILEAKDPLAAFRVNEEKYVQGGGFGGAAETIPGAETEKRLKQNSKLLTQAGGQSVPTIVFRDASGLIKVSQGAPSGKRLDALLARVK